MKIHILYQFLMRVSVVVNFFITNTRLDKYRYIYALPRQPGGTSSAINILFIVV